MERSAPGEPTAAPAPSPAGDRRARPSRRSVPAFALYGEPAGTAQPAVGALHVEALPARSRLYRWEIEPHVHRGSHQVIWLARGGAELSLDEQHGACAGPAAIVIPPGVVHAFRFAPESDGCVLTLNAGALVEGQTPALGDALRALFSRAQVLRPPPGSDTQRLQALFDALLDEFADPAASNGPVPLWLARSIVWRLAQLEARLSRSADAARRPQRALYTRFVLLVEAHHAEHWPVRRYASALGLSTERLNRLVRAESGLSALALIHQRLVREACRRLVYVEVPVSRLADELGFSDAGYFCRFFKRHTGCPPGEYRQRHAAAA